MEANLGLAAGHPGSFLLIPYARHYERVFSNVFLQALCKTRNYPFIRLDGSTDTASELDRFTFALPILLPHSSVHPRPPVKH